MEKLYEKVDKEYDCAYYVKRRILQRERVIIFFLFQDWNFILIGIIL